MKRTHNINIVGALGMVNDASYEMGVGEFFEEVFFDEQDKGLGWTRKVVHVVDEGGWSSSSSEEVLVESGKGVG